MAGQRFAPTTAVAEVLAVCLPRCQPRVRTSLHVVQPARPAAHGGCHLQLVQRRLDMFTVWEAPLPREGELPLRRNEGLRLTHRWEGEVGYGV